MANDTVQRLNEKYALVNHLSFETEPGELIVAKINNELAAATVALNGGHVISYQPHNQQPVLWASRHSHFQPGQPIRGGIPVAWPWFANHPTDSAKPAHGFVRTAQWAVSGTGVFDEQASQLRLGLTDTEAMRALWPHAFQLELVITVGSALEVELRVRNPGTKPFTCGGALHSYFSVSDVRQITIQGLDNGTYIDKVDEFRRKAQQGPLTIESETDRIYLDTKATCIIEDPGWSRRIEVGKSGSQSTVIWNPWIDKARDMPDFGDDEFGEMVCIETANAADDQITVAPGGEYRLRAVIGLV